MNTTFIETVSTSLVWPALAQAFQARVEDEATYQLLATTHDVERTSVTPVALVLSSEQPDEAAETLHDQGREYGGDHDQPSAEHHNWEVVADQMLA